MRGPQRATESTRSTSRRSHYRRRCSSPTICARQFSTARCERPDLDRNAYRRAALCCSCTSATIAPDVPLAWLCKGFEQSSGQLPHQIVREELGDRRQRGAAVGAQLRDRSRVRLAHGSDGRRRARILRARDRSAAWRRASNLFDRRCGRGRSRRRRQECHGNRHRHLGCTRARPQCARRADHARAGRDHSLRRRARRARRNIYGPDRHRRFDSDGDRRSFAQPQGGLGPRARRDDGSGGRRTRSRGRRRAFGARGVDARAPVAMSTCRSPRPYARCSTAL